MSAKYTKLQANTLNMLSEAAKHVREQTEFVKRSVEQIELAMANAQQPSRTFGKNNLSEAISRFIAVENMTTEVLLSTGLDMEDTGAALELARTYDENSYNGRHFFHEG